MTEANVFRNLLKKDYDFPKLNSESVSLIANNFADIVYESLKFKSISAVNKRINILKFLQLQAALPDNHLTLNKDNYKKFIEIINTGSGESEDLNIFLNQVKSELEGIEKNLSDEIQKFYKRKNERHREKIKNLELITKYDQEGLDQVGFCHKISNKIAYYETSDSLISNLLGDNKQMMVNKSLDDYKTHDYREKQVKCAYALANLSDWTNLKPVLENLIKYENLSAFEVNFLSYLHKILDTNCELSNFLVANFEIIFEKYLIRLCTEIIRFENEPQVFEFFERLLIDPEFVKFKGLINTHDFLGVKLKNLLCELYSFSYCNSNLLKFQKFLVD